MMSGCKKNHAALDIVSVCCGERAVWLPFAGSVCSRCREHTGWERYCDVCGEVLSAEEPLP